MATLADLTVGGDQLAADLEELLNTARMVEFLAEFSGISGGGIAVEAVDAGAVFSDPVAIAAGIAAIIIAVSFKWIVAQPLAYILGKVPFVGGTLAGWALDVGNWEWNTVADWAHTAMDALSAVIQTVRTIVGLPWLALKIIGDIIYRVQWIQNTQVPNLVNDAFVYAANLQSQVFTYATTLYNEAIAHADADGNYALNYATDKFNEAIAHADADGQYALTFAQNLFNGVEADIATLHTQLDAEIQSEIAQVELGLGHLVTEAEQYTDAAVQAAESNLGGLIAAGVATAVAVADGFGNALNGFLNQCGDDLCSANGKNAKNVNALAKLIETGALFAFLAECINDPVGTAGWSAPILTATEGTALGLVDSLVTAVA